MVKSFFGQIHFISFMIIFLNEMSPKKYHKKVTAEPGFCVFLGENFQQNRNPFAELLVQTVDREGRFGISMFHSTPTFNTFITVLVNCWCLLFFFRCTCIVELLHSCFAALLNS